MTQVEIIELMEKAEKHVIENGGKCVTLSHFYRTKSTAYFDEIRQRHYGIMRKYIKIWVVTKLRLLTEIFSDSFLVPI